MGLSQVAIGNTLGAHIGNPLGTWWEQRKNEWKLNHGQTKKNGIKKKMRCYWEHLGRHNWKLGEHFGNKQPNKKNFPPLALLPSNWLIFNFLCTCCPYEFTLLFVFCICCPMNLWIYFDTSQHPHPLSPFACCTLKDYYILVARILCILSRHVGLILGME